MIQNQLFIEVGAIVRLRFENCFGCRGPRIFLEFVPRTVVVPILGSKSGRLRVSKRSVRNDAKTRVRKNRFYDSGWLDL